MLQGQPFKPTKYALQILTDALRRVGRSLKGTHIARGTWPLPRCKLHIKYLELKAAFLALKGFQPLPEQYCCCSCRQHHGGCLYKEGGGDETRPSLCPLMENPDLVYQETGDPQNHSQPAKRDSRQAIQARTEYSNRMVPPSRGLQAMCS